MSTFKVNQWNNQWNEFLCGKLVTVAVTVVYVSEYLYSKKQNTVRETIFRKQDFFSKTNQHKYQANLKKLHGANCGTCNG